MRSGGDARSVTAGAIKSVEFSALRIMDEDVWRLSEIVISVKLLSKEETNGKEG